MTGVWLSCLVAHILCNNIELGSSHVMTPSFSGFSCYESQTSNLKSGKEKVRRQMCVAEVKLARPLELFYEKGSMEKRGGKYYLTMAAAWRASPNSQFETHQFETHQAMNSNPDGSDCLAKVFLVRFYMCDVWNDL
jgi:hypothetical protein